jgi:hypothetical protein
MAHDRRLKAPEHHPLRRERDGVSGGDELNGAEAEILCMASADGSGGEDELSGIAFAPVSNGAEGFSEDDGAEVE